MRLFVMQSLPRLQNHVLLSVFNSAHLQKAFYAIFISGKKFVVVLVLGRQFVGVPVGYPELVRERSEAQAARDLGV
jgi:hypothetical protein